MSEAIHVAEIFGENVFDDAVMRERLPKSVYKKLKQTIEDGSELDPSIADVVAHAMKDWAVDNGATHYTHWFQPLTGVTAEKHDSFITSPDAAGRVLMDLSGKELIKGEADGSSFPSGGLRATFEARGYTTWDCTSPAFLKKDALGVTLCIPTAFCSYGGEALDKKTPLLRSMEAIDKQAVRIFHLFGNTAVKRVIPSVGPEQEYFLVDREKYLQRKDLIYTGRTLFGAMPPKGQEMDDHYYGVIRERVGAFMKELNEELWKLGVAAKTQHNEVAPAQHELAAIYTKANLAVDHNQIVMETMKKVASRRGLACLLHEKPFQGVNGSGKHNNWSLTSDTGINMLEPGVTPHENIQFLLVLACIMKAVDVHADLLRQSASCVGNEHRLGGQEAPPAIISIFLGDQLTEVVEKIIDGKASVHATRGVLDLGADTLPKLMQDNTDRNRTSPFAFTGNKFEFRACGSEQNVSDSNLVLDAAVAKSLKSFADALEGTPEDKFQDAALEYCKKVLTDHQRILFSGDGYSDEWPVEAEKRGLANNKTTADALPAFVSDKAIALFEETGVLTKAEAQCRYDCKLEKYNKLMNIEATTMVREARRTYRPVITAYATKVAKGLETIRAAGAEAAMQCEQNTLNKLCNGITTINDSIKALDAVHQKAEGLDGQEQANVYAHEVVPAMDALRAAVDAMEEIVAADYWPVPTYDDILFYV